MLIGIAVYRKKYDFEGIEKCKQDGWDLHTDEDIVYVEALVTW